MYKMKGLNKFAQGLMSRSTAYLMRWHHRAVTWRESLAEHHALVARMTYEVTTLLQYHGYDVRPETAMRVALYHDDEELITGDMPSPAKRRLPDGVYSNMKDIAISELWSDYPESLADHLRDTVHQSELSDIEKQIILYTDKLGAYAYVYDTVLLGNQKMIDILEGIESDDYLKSMDWEWLAFLRKEYGLP